MVCFFFKDSSMDCVARMTPWLTFYTDSETSLIASTDTILEAVDKKELTAIVYLDMSKAFDSINHSILLQKLKAIGLVPSAVSWFNNYLSQRSQVVRINAALSDTLHVVCGVWSASR